MSARLTFAGADVAATEPSSARITAAGAEAAATEHSRARLTYAGLEYAIALPDTLTLPFDMEARFISRASGLRLAVNPDDLLDITYELLESGGLGQCGVTLARPYDDDLGVSGGDTLEIWARNPDGSETLRGRAQIAIPEPSLDLKERWQLTAYGRMEDLNHVLLDKVITHPGGADLRVFVAEIADDYAARRPDLVFVRDIQDVGVSMETLTLANVTARAAMDQLQDQAAKNAVWGWDIDPDTNLDRFYLRPRVQIVGHQWFAGANVKVLSTPLDYSNIVNGVKLQGGPARYPQLITNPSFEVPTVPDAATGSLLIDGSFEQNIAWTYANGASQNRYDPSSNHNSSAHSGQYYALLDNPTEEIWQEVAVTPGVQYNASLFIARESGSYANLGSFIIEGRNAGGAIVETPTPLPLAPPSTAWTGGQGSTILSGDALALSVTFQDPTITKARIRVRTSNGFGGKGLLVDDVVFAPAGALGQQAWSTHLQNPGSAANQFVWIDWACRAAAYEGIYGVRLSVIADTDNRPALSPSPGDNSSAPGYHYKPNAQQNLLHTAQVRMAPGLNAAAGLVRLEYREWASDGHETQHIYGGDFPIPNDGQWHQFALSTTAHGDAATATTQLVFAADGVYDVDCISARDAAAGVDPVDFLRGANFERYLTAEQVCDVGTPAYNSAATYGRREAVISNSDIIDYNDSTIAYAKAYFERQALPLGRGRLELTHEHVQIPSPGEGTQIRVSQLNDDVQEWAARAQYTWRQSALTILMDLDTTRPTLAILLSSRSGSASGGGSGNASSIAAVSSGAGGGVTTPSPAYWGDTPRTETDATLHDDYAPSGGPHVQAAERTAWDGVASEVETARSTYSSLDARLDAIEAAEGGGGGGGGGATTLAALTDVDSSAKADGYLLGWDAATSKNIYVPPPSGGGGSSSPGLSIASGGLPLLSAFTKVHGADFTAVQNSDGSIRLEVPATALVGALLFAAPATPYVFTVGIVGNSYLTNLNLFGPCLQQSSTGKYILFNIGWNSGDTTRPQFWILHNNGSASNVDGTVLNSGYPLFQYIFLRISDDGTTRKFSISNDGFVFMQVASEASGSYITPDHVGFGFTTYGTPANFSGSVFYWDIS